MLFESMGKKQPFFLSVEGSNMTKPVCALIKSYCTSA